MSLAGLLSSRAGRGSAAPAAHLVGVCGSGMQALAELLSGMGWRVSGSDQESPSDVTELLSRRGLVVHRGHEPGHLPHHADVLVYSQAVGPANAERQRAVRRGIPQLSYSQMLGQLMSQRRGVSIAGTHGKSTTTAMTAWLLDDAGLEPSAIIGARLLGRDASGFAGAGELMVVESCEYRRSFLDLAPHFAVITGIEADHFDCYLTLDEAVEAYGAFASSVSPEGLLLVSADCPAATVAAQRSRAKVETLGRRPGADWWAADTRRTVAGSRFRLFYRGAFQAEITVPVPGRHNVDNALASAAMAMTIGVDPRAVQEGMGDFPGIRRRFQSVGMWRGVTVIDDYAHHPTAVRATLETARQAYPGRRIWCAFQPHQVSRTVALLDDFAVSLSMADRVLLLPIYGAREVSGGQDRRGRLVSEELADRIEAWQAERMDQEPSCQLIPSLDHLVRTLDDDTRPGDVLITMGAGDIDRVQYEFTR